MRIEDFLERLSKAKRNGKGWTSLCPAHADNTPSLSIKEVNGKILIKCFSGCTVEAICSELGLEVKDLFNGHNGFKSNGNGAVRNGQPRTVVAEYDYVDEDGSLLFQTVRYEPKDFRQRRPDGAGGWIWNLKDTRLVLYRLPEVIASPVVYIVEGEKDVETLRKHGLPATCCPLGAGKWRDEYNEHLVDKVVVILPDNDKPGCEHAEKIARSLYAVAKEVIVVNLPGLPEKGDITDYFENGGSVDELTDLVKNAEAWKPREQMAEKDVAAEEVANLFTVKPANQWIDEAKLRPVPKMLFGEFFFEGELCISFSDTNLGKSILAVQIGESIATGREIGILQMTGKPRPVLYLDFELSDKQFEARYSIQSGDYFTNHYRFSDNFLRAEINPEQYDTDRFSDLTEYLNYSLEAQIAETGATVLIVDNITYLRNETEKAKDALPLMKHLKKIKSKFGISILALAHTPKRDPTKPITKNDLQGSRHLLNFCDSSFAIGESHKDKSFRYLKQIKERNTAKIYDSENVMLFQIEKPENFLQFRFEGFARESEHLKVLSDADREELIQKAKKLSGQGKSQRTIAAELSISIGAVNKYLNL